MFIGFNYTKMQSPREETAGEDSAMSPYSDRCMIGCGSLCIVVATLFFFGNISVIVWLFEHKYPVKYSVVCFMLAAGVLYLTSFTNSLLLITRTTKSRHVFMEPSWQSWLFFCLCTTSAILTASSGEYFHRNSLAKSSIICIAVSVLGFTMAFVTFVAILMGCQRRQRFSALMNNNVERSICENPGISEQSTCIQIEQDFLTSRPEAENNQMWMNPVYTEYELSPFEKVMDDGKDLEKDFEQYETDFDERDSDYFHSSSNTVTCSYRSYSDDEGYFQCSSKERNLKETGKNCLELKFIPGEKFLGSGQIAENIPIPNGSTFDLNEKSSTNLQKLNLFQVPLHHNLNSSKMRKCFQPYSKSPNIETKNVFYSNLSSVDNTTSGFHSNPEGSCFHPNKVEQELHSDLVEQDNGVHQSHTNSKNNHQIFVTREENVKLTVDDVNESHTCVEHCSGVFVTEPSLEINNSAVSMVFENAPADLHKKNDYPETDEHCSSVDQLSSTIDRKDNFSIVANVEAEPHSNIRQCKSSHLPETLQKPIRSQSTSMNYKNCPPADVDSDSITPNQISVENKKTEQRCASSQKSNLPSQFPSLPYPILPNDALKQSKKRRRHSEKHEGALMQRYEKRPLVDVNGNPLSQETLVTALTKLFTNDFEGLPKHQLKNEAENQTLGLDIDALQPLPC